MRELQNHQHSQKRRAELQRQKQMIAATKKRNKKRREKKLASETPAGVEMREKLAGKVNKILRAKLAPYQNVKGNKPRWFKPLNAVDTRLTSHLAVNSFIDAAAKNLNTTAAREQMGRIFVALLFEQLVMGTGQKEREFERFKAKLKRKIGDAYRRVDVFHARAKDLGFDIETYGTTKMVLSIGTELLNCCTTAHLTEWEKVKKGNGKQFSGTRYISLRKEIRDQLKHRNETHFDLQSPLFGALGEKPHGWYKRYDSWSISGCYDDHLLNQRLHVVRHMGAAQKAEVEQRIEDGQMDAALNALHTIQNAPYVINEYVLRAVQWVKAQDRGSEVGSWPNLLEVDEPEDLPDADWEAMSPQAKKAFNTHRRKLKEGNMAARGNLVNIMRYTQPYDEKTGDRGTAEEWLEMDELFMPHNFDNRGRVYHINTMGHHDTDYLRAMFKFKNEQEITEDNLHWLALQILNSYGNGQDKLPVEQHRDWVLNNHDTLMLVGTDYEASFGHWSQADEPFQFLAACHEYANFKTAEAKGEAYLSGLPIAVDASQSGVQHFALALLNKDDAERVNLSASGQRGDIYEDCLVVAKQIMDADLIEKQQQLKDDPVTADDRLQLEAFEAAIIDKELSKAGKKKLRRQWNKTPARLRLKTEKEVESIKQVKAWSGNVPMPYGRKVIKRNIMTYCYSSRQFGFSQQLRSDWMDKLSEMVRLGKLAQHPFGVDEGFAASTYLGGVHERAVTQVVKSAAIGMDFIQKLVKILATYKLPEDEIPEDVVQEEEENEYGDKKKRTHNKDGIHLRFLTPNINFPMYQNYVKEDSPRVHVSLYDMEVDNGAAEYDDYLQYRELDHTHLWVEKSISACAPNIIHAMDATHLMMTVNDCAEQGVTDLMVVHDSFASTIGNMGVLSRSLRAMIVKLYQHYHLYEDLLAQAKALHPEPETVKWPKVPERQDFDIEEVYDSLHSFL